MSSKQPKVGDVFYNEAIQMTGCISRIYTSEFTGEKVLDVEYPGLDLEEEVYRLDKIIYHKGDKNLDECFICKKGYYGE